MDASDKDIIVQGLQKIIDQMESLETNRILPDGHPNKTADVMVPEPEVPAAAPEEVEGDMDPGVLDELMAKASSGEGEEMDGGDDLPPEILAAVADKKKKPLV